MLENLLLLLKEMPKELITVIVATLPVSELRGAIPLGLFGFKLPLLKVFFLSIFGNLLPVIPLLLFLEPITSRVRRIRILHSFFERLFARTKSKAYLVERYEALGLILFVAIPLPVTGAWTGCIAASLFKIRFRYAFLAICAGVLIAAIIVSAVAKIGGGIFFHLFLSQ